MKKYLAALLIAALAFVAPAAAQTINNLGAGAAVLGTHLFPTYQGANPAKSVTAAQISAYVNSLFSGDCTVTGTGTISCTKTGGVALAPIATSGSAASLTTGTLPAARMPALTGDATSTAGTAALTLNTVNSNTGAFGGATTCVAVAVNAKGLVTAVSAVTCTPAIGSISGLGANIAAFLATPSCANFALAVTSETGTGSCVFATSPAFTGTPTAPTAAPGTNTTQLATTAFVLANTGGGGSVSITATCGNVASPSPITGTGTLSSVMPVNPQTGTNYPIVSTDCGKLINLANAAAQVPTLPTAASVGAGWYVQACNQGAGAQTITPTTSTIGGASTYVLPAGSVAAGKCAGIVSDGTNYQVIPSFTTGGGSTSTIASGTATIPNTAIASGACGTVITVTASGVATTDVVAAGFAADPTSTTGFLPTAMLTIVPFAASGSVGFRPCNLTSASITPTLTVLNWRVTR